MAASTKSIRASEAVARLDEDPAEHDRQDANREVEEVEQHGGLAEPAGGPPAGDKTTLGAGPLRTHKEGLRIRRPSAGAGGSGRDKGPRDGQAA